jgi:hypothetical protein
MAVCAVDLFPKLNPPQLEPRKLLIEFSTQALLHTLLLTFLTAGEHPKAIASSSDKKYPAVFYRHEL